MNKQRIIESNGLTIDLSRVKCIQVNQFASLGPINRLVVEYLPRAEYLHNPETGKYELKEFYDRIVKDVQDYETARDHMLELREAWDDYVKKEVTKAWDGKVYFPVPSLEMLWQEDEALSREKKLSSYIWQQQDRIIESEGMKKGVDQYCAIQKAYEQGNVAENAEFRKNFKAFYGLNIAHLGDGFEKRYFELMEELRGKQEISLYAVEEQLAPYKSLKDQKREIENEEESESSLQFSFLTKLLHTVDNNRPIYDSKVAGLFGFTRPISTTLPRVERLKEYEKRLETIEATYWTILEEKLLTGPIEHFKERFKETGISDMKVVDFLFWQAGKLKG